MWETRQLWVLQQLEVTSCSVSRQAWHESVVQRYCSHHSLLYPNYCGQIHLISFSMRMRDDDKDLVGFLAFFTHGKRFKYCLFTSESFIRSVVLSPADCLQAELVAADTPGSRNKVSHLLITDWETHVWWVMWCVYSEVCQLGCLESRHCCEWINK